MRAKGYTLVELLVVLAVMGLLATMAMPLAELVVQRDKERELKRALWEIRDAIDDYKRVRERAAAAGAAGAAAGSFYPPDLQALVMPMNQQPGPPMRWLRRIPRDPFADPSEPAERTWGLRSYQSEADAPRPGADVYDVYSRSERVGLNGIPLKRW